MQYDNNSWQVADQVLQQQYASVTANASLPIVIWPWHDYGAAAYQTDGSSNPSPYNTQAFTDFIANAYNNGDEFVTMADLANRMASFDQSTVTSSVSGNVITATITSPATATNALTDGTFALDVSGQGSEVIESATENGVAYYAYDATKLFVPADGGSFAITLGTTASAVTHITALPMRADLLSVSGDGTNLSFSVAGQGDVTIELGEVGANLTPVVTGASIASLAGNQLVLSLLNTGTNTVTLTMRPARPVISGAVADQTVTDQATITPFSGVTIAI